MTSIANDLSSNYELIVGLEVHIQLKTNSKIFSSDCAAFITEPNEHLSPVSLGLPGTLPVLNEKTVEYAVKMGLGTNCKINQESRFDRKNYFYADLPKGYQITQNEMPICTEGFIKIGENKIAINRIHMEEDAGKSIHTDITDDTFVDLNRAGVPLLELVTEPDIRSAEEAGNFLSEIRKIARYLDVSDGNMEEGSVRCDANISIRLKGTKQLGNRCEVKNLNSIKNTQRAIEYEFKRQVAMAENNEPILQQTLNFDASTGTTSPLRSKELANDYRYMPDPDLLPVTIGAEYITSISQSLPELPASVEERLSKAGLSDYIINVLSSEKALVDFYDKLVLEFPVSKSVANFIIGPLKSYLNENNQLVTNFPLKPQKIAELLTLVEQNKVSNTVALQQVLPAMLKHTNKSALEISKELQVLISVNDNQLEHVIAEILAQNPGKVKEYNNGKKGIAGMFMGEVMKKTGGTINPQEANQLIIKKLEELK